MVGTCENGVVGSDFCGIDYCCAILELKEMVGKKNEERIISEIVNNVKLWMYLVLLINAF